MPRTSPMPLWAPLAVALACACGPLPGQDECSDASDCLAGQLCALDTGVARCTDVGGEGEGEGDAGEGEGSASEGEGNASEGEGSEGEGEGASAGVSVEGPLVAPVGVLFAVRFSNTGTGVADSGCIASVDNSGAVPVGTVAVNGVGPHDVVVTCGAVSSPVATVEGWDVRGFAVAAGAAAVPQPVTVTWTVGTLGAVSAGDVICDIHVHATSGLHPPADAADVAIASGGAVLLQESSDVAVSSCVHVDELGLATGPRDIGAVDVVPAAPRLALSVNGAGTATLSADVTTAGAESCAWKNQLGGFGVGLAVTRAAASQTVFQLTLSKDDVGAGPATPFVVVCTTGFVSSPASSAVVVHGADVDDRIADLDGVNVQLGGIHATPATATLALPALTHVAGAIDVVADDRAPSALSATSLVQVTGAVTLVGAGLAGFDLELGSDDLVTPGPPLELGALILQGNAGLAGFAMRRLSACNGALDVEGNTGLAALDLPSLTSAVSFHVSDNGPPLTCADIASRYCALVPPRDPAPITRDAVGADCAPEVAALCP